MVPGAKDGRETFLLTFEILLSNTRSEFSVLVTFGSRSNSRPTDVPPTFPNPSRSNFRSTTRLSKF